MVARERGLTVMEVVCALAVLTIIVTSVMVGEKGQLAGAARSFDVLAASRAAAARVESLYLETDVPLRAGESWFDVDLPACDGIQSVRALAPGLYEVTVVVSQRGNDTIVRLTTLVLRKVPR